MLTQIELNESLLKAAERGDNEQVKNLLKQEG